MRLKHGYLQKNFSQKNYPFKFHEQTNVFIYIVALQNNCIVHDWERIIVQKQQ